METSTHNISELKPEQREAAEKLLGRSLANFQNAAIRVIEGGNEIVIRFFGGQKSLPNGKKSGGWDIPACFQVLDDLNDQQQAEYNAAISQPVRLSRSS